MKENFCVRRSWKNKNLCSQLLCLLQVQSFLVTLFIIIIIIFNRVRSLLFSHVELSLKPRPQLLSRNGNVLADLPTSRYTLLFLSELHSGEIDGVSEVEVFVLNMTCIRLHYWKEVMEFVYLIALLKNFSLLILLDDILSSCQYYSNIKPKYYIMKSTPTS